MRIIGGQAAGRLLKVPKGMAVRPTPDLVRQAIFNRLQGRLEGVVVLELFGGTAALSLECLSRGARRAICVEKAARHGRMILSNLADLGLAPDRFELRVQDVFTALPQLAAAGELFDFILADPPFGDKNVGRRSTSLSQRLLDHETLPSLLRPHGVFVLGHTARDTVSLSEGWSRVKILRHGDSQFQFLERSPG